MATTEDKVNGLGGKLAAKVTEQVVRAQVATRERLAEHTVRTGMGLQEAFFRLTGSEIKATIGPAWEPIADNEDMPTWARNIAEFLSRGHGQWQTLLAGGITGVAMGSGFGQYFTNLLTPAISGAIAATPNLRLSPQEAAAVDVRGLNWGADLAFEAAGQGLNRDRYDALRQLAVATLSPADVLEMYRRHLFDDGDYKRYMNRIGFEGSHATQYKALARTLISPADAVSMINRSALTQAQFEGVMAVNGYTLDDAKRMQELGGEPPPPEMLYTAFRRGFIDEDRLRRGIVQGPIRNEWFDVLEKLQFRSMTPDSAASAVTQGHMTLARGQEVAKEYGLDPDDFSILVETAGRPPGVEFAAEAFNRGLIDSATYDRMFLESAIKNTYLPLLREMRTRLLPQETARSLLAKGVITEDRVVATLRGHGFAADDIEALIAASTTERTEKTRDLSLSAVRELYAEQEITPEAATDMLLALGFDATEAQWELDLADLARVRTYRNAVISRVRAGFVKGLLSEDDAVTTLDSLQVPPARRDSLMSLWVIEQQTVTRDLTPAQLVAGAKKGLMPSADALARLVGQGYAESDALVLLATAGVSVGP